MTEATQAEGQLVIIGGYLSPIEEGEGEEGWYFIKNNKLKTFHSYKIEAIIDDKTYSSSYQKVNKKVDLDSVSNKSYDYLIRNGYQFNFAQYNTKNPNYLVGSFTDPIEDGNYYTWIYNGFDLKNIRTFSDQDFANGNQIPFEVLWFNRIVSDESLSLYQLSINENYYNYINDIQNILGESTPFSTPPSNPKNNLFCVDDPNEMVLGFFEIATATSKRYEYQETE